MAERWTDPDDYKGTRTKGRRVATIWWSMSNDEGDVTVTEYFDELDVHLQMDVLRDAIGMLKRQLAVCEKEYKRQFNEMREAARGTKN